MVTHLLESGTRKHRSVGGAIPSMALHSVLILAAINATAHAALRAPDRPHVVPVPLAVPNAPVRPTDNAVPRSAPSRDRNRFEVPEVTGIPVLPRFAGPAFTFDPGSVASPVIHGSDFGGGVTARNSIDGSGSNSATVLSSDQVDRQAAALPGTLAPHYPEALRARGVEGTVVARFVVDSAGHAEPGSFVVVGSANPLFSSAVETALLRARFRAAESNGVRVRQLVEQSFAFTRR